MSLKPIFINARDISDAWFQTIYACLDYGKEFVIDSGSFAGQKRLELDYITIHIKQPGYPYDKKSLDEMMPKIPSHYCVPDPVCEGYMDEYLPYLMTEEMKENECYTYGSRIWSKLGENVRSNQVHYIIDTYKNKGFRNNQMVLQIAQPIDLFINDPPCLRYLDTRIQDNKLHFFGYWRSWDLWSGFPVNLGGIQFLKEYMANEIGVEDGEMICSSKGIHLYDHVFDIARKLKGDNCS